MRTPHHRSLLNTLTNRALAVFVVVGGAFFLPIKLAQAAPSPSPISEAVNVTLTVPVNDAPTTPILISPTNNSTVTTSLVSFVWQGSTDSHGIGEYQLWLDGLLYFDDIPITPTDNSQYTLTYDSLTDQYTLTVKTPITEGTHTWKIRVIDTIGTGVTDSVTWTFTIDTLAPNFVITQIGDATVAISAQDNSTIPSSPVELEDNEPLVIGTGEANSSVVMTVTIPGDPTQVYAFTIDSSGNWQQQLGILPRETVITLDFVITDLAGNVTVLSGVQFIILAESIVIPPPTPGVSPTPGASPEVGTPIVEIPILPPREIIFNVAQEVFELLPEPLKALVTSLPPQALEALKNLAPISTALVVTAIPLLATAAIATQFGARFSLELLARILQALGLIPSGKPRGFVFDSHTHKGIPFALLTITSVTDTTRNEPLNLDALDLNTIPLIETVVSDVEGVYKGVELPPGKYQIDVRHQEYRFPTALQRPSYLTLKDYYRGEVFEILSDKDAELLFLIPMDPIEETGHRNWRNQIRVVLAYLSRFSSLLVLPLFVLSGILTLLFPSVWNWIVFGIYTIVVCYKSIQWFRVPRLTGVVIDSAGRPVENAIVRLLNTETSELVLVTNTKVDGRFSAFVEPQKYGLSVVKPGYVWTDAPVGSFFEVDLTTSAQHMIATIEPIERWV